MSLWPFRKEPGSRPDGGGDPTREFLGRLSARGWTPEGPADPASVSAAEEALGVIFPPDYRRFLLATGRPSQREPWFGLWRVDELVNLNLHLPTFRWYPGLVGIGTCGGFLVIALDYRESPVPRVVSVGLSSSEPTDVTVEADSFAEWLDRTLR